MKVGTGSPDNSGSFEACQVTSFDGLSLYYRRYGSGKDVILCLHGLTRNSKDFHALASHITSRPGNTRTILCPDIRGRGRSDHSRNHLRYNPATYVRDAWRLLDQAQIHRVVIIGTSLGGLMAMMMADQQPDRIDGIVLNDIGPELPPAALARIMSYAGKLPPARNWPAAATQVKQAYEIAYPDMPDDFWQEFVRLSYREDSDGLPAPDMDPAIGTALRHPSLAMKLVHRLHQAGWLRRMGGVNIDPWDSFRSITMPCLLLHGQISDVLTPDIVAKMSMENPQLKVQEIPNRGHAPLLDEPQSLQAIEQFLYSLQGAGPG